MKIAIIVSNTNDPKTGTASVSINLAKQMTLKGNACRLIFREDVFRRREGSLTQLLFAFALPALRSLWSYDVLDINAGDGLVIALLLKWFKGTSRPLLVARSHGLEHIVRDAYRAEAKAGRLSLSWKYPIYHGGYRPWQVKKYLQQADLVFFLNNRERDYAIANFGLAPERVKIVDNGLPDYLIGRSVAYDGNAAPRLAVVGTFSQRKGAAFVVHALINLLEKYQALRVGFFGINSTEDAILRSFPEHLHPRINIQATYEHESLPALLVESNIMLMASLAEGYGMVALEGMACGLALVATNVSGIAERLTDRANALLIAPGSIEAIENAIAELIENPQLLDAIRRAGYRFAQDYSWMQVADKTLALYKSVINETLLGTGRK